MWKQRKVLGSQALAEKENDKRSPSSGPCEGRGGEEEWVFNDRWLGTVWLQFDVVRPVVGLFLIPGDSTCTKVHQQAEEEVASVLN